MDASTETPEDGFNGPEVLIPTLKSLFIEMCVGDVRIGTGTATLVANDKKSHCTLITNRHIVTGRHQDTGATLHSQGGVPDNLVIYFYKKQSMKEWVKITLPLYRADGSPWWIEHPRLGSSADIVALNLTWGNDVSKLPYYLKDTLDRANMVVSPAENISVIGFPFGMSSAARYPIWATGFLAQELSLITPQNPVFLIDCRTRQGQSGSAVIAYRPNGYRTIEGNRLISHISAAPAWEFLGIYSGRVNAESILAGCGMSRRLRNC